MLIAAVLLCAGCVSRRTGPAPVPRAVETIVHAHAPSGSPRPFTVGTYNVHALRKHDAVRRDLAKLEQVTVWCFQEFPHADDRRDLERVLPAGRWHVATVPLNRDAAIPGGWESQVIASRFPIERVDVWPLDDGDSIGGGKRRAALAARLNVNDRPVLVVNTDHEPSILAWRNGNDVQVRRLAERLRDCGEETVVVAGDFNCSGNVFRLISNSGHARRVDAAMADAGFTPVTPAGATYRAGAVRAQLDRIYARQVRPTASSIARDANGSDHFPVWGRFHVSPPTNDRTIPGTAMGE